MSILVGDSVLYLGRQYIVENKITFNDTLSIYKLKDAELGSYIYLLF